MDPRARRHAGRRPLDTVAPDLTKELCDRFAWVDGHADVWRWLADGALLRRIVAALADPYRSDGVTLVAGVEARGFVLASAAAVELGAGFLAIRKDAGLLPGEKMRQTAPPDYRDHVSTLRMQAGLVGSAARVLLVDDWAETGSQALTARSLIERRRAVFVGTSLIVDQLPAATKTRLGRVSALIPAAMLA